MAEMQPPICHNCRYWEGDERECRRWTPHGWSGRTHRRVFPVTDATDWCGSHERTLRALQADEAKEPQ